MATLYSRITENTAPPGDDTNQLDPHAFPWAMVLAATGSPTITRNGIVSFFSLDVEATTQLDAIIANYGSKNNIQKAAYRNKFQPAIGLARDGLYTEAQFDAELEI